LWTTDVCATRSVPAGGGNRSSVVLAAVRCSGVVECDSVNSVIAAR
jgi:hypothetical protein